MRSKVVCSGEPRGTGGFGYDPFFEGPDLGGTFAEASIERTARTSHRTVHFVAAEWRCAPREIG